MDPSHTHRTLTNPEIENTHQDMVEANASREHQLAALVQAGASPAQAVSAIRRADDPITTLVVLGLYSLLAHGGGWKGTLDLALTLDLHPLGFATGWVPVQDAEIQPRIPGTVRFHRGCAQFLPPLLPLVQPPAPAQRHRDDDARQRPRRPRRGDPRCPAGRARSRLPGPPRAVFQGAVVKSKTCPWPRRLSAAGECKREFRQLSVSKSLTRSERGTRLAP